MVENEIRGFKFQYPKFSGRGRYSLPDSRGNSLLATRYCRKSPLIAEHIQPRPGSGVTLNPFSNQPTP